MGGQTSDAAARRAAGRRWLAPLRRRVLLGAISILVPAIILGGMEGALRLAGFGGYPPTFRAVGGLSDGSQLIFTQPAGPASFFFSSRSQGLALDPVALVDPKPEGTLRVIWVGESAAKGIPQPRHLRASAFFESMLSDLRPDAEVEVINVGVPGVAAYPVLKVLQESLRYQPDLVVAYLGNNEFYGAYGVASLHTAGRSPQMIRLTRAVRSLGIAQAMDSALRGRVVVEPESLMEAMVGQSYIGPDDALRRAAARNLEVFVGAMVDCCHARGLPMIVCLPPTNERGMAPLGTADLSGLGPQQRARLGELLQTASTLLESNAAGSETAARSALELHPEHARAYHLLGRALEAQGRIDEALEAYRASVDLDPMPWRPPRSSVEAIRAAAVSREAAVADLEAAFRAASGGGAIGWDLIDDHVHPTLRGQVLVAREVARTMVQLKGPLHTELDAVQALPGWERYAERHGANRYDQYAVAHAMRVFGSFEIFRAPNPWMRERNDAICREIEAAEDPVVVAQLRDWADPQSGIGQDFPIAGLVADVRRQQGRFDEASTLFGIAAEASTPYGSRRVAFQYFALESRVRDAGALATQDIAEARDALAEGSILIATGGDRSGQASRFVGQLHLLLGEPREAIEHLERARDLLQGRQRLATDEALVRALVATGQAQRASAVIEEGLAGPNAPLYRTLRALAP